MMYELAISGFNKVGRNFVDLADIHRVLEKENGFEN